MADAASDNLALFNALAGFTKTLTGTKSDVTVSGGETTRQTMYSKEAMDSLLKGLMEGTAGRGGGLAALSRGQKSAGLYNTSARSMLTNDFTTRAAAEVAKLSAPEVTSRAPQVTRTANPGVVKGSTAGATALAALVGTEKGREFLKKGYKGVTELLGGASDGLSSALSGFGGSSVGDAGGGLAALTSDYGAGFSGDYGVGAAGELAGFVTGGGSIPSYDFMPSIMDFGSYGNTAALGMDQVGSIYDAADAADTMSQADMMASMSDFGDAADAAGSFGMPGFGSIARAASGDVNGAIETYAVAQIPVVGPYIAAFDAVTGSHVGSDIVERGGDMWEDAVDFFSGDSSCFITTAACLANNRPDDCHELTVLRRFRDTWLTEWHKDDIQQYYAEAPVIVSKISAREDATRIFKSLDVDYIQPAVAAIEYGNNTLAYAIYKNLFNTAREYANG